MISGRIAATVEAMIRAFGFSPERLAFSSDITSTAAAPSFSGQALPAVTVPSGLNAGFSCASTSIVVPGARPVVLGDDGLGDVDLVALLVDVLVRRYGYGTISLSKWPESRASTARFCEITAHSSCCSRVTLQRSATFSAVSPIGM